MSKDTGGPAFPCEWDYIDSTRQMANGMTMRDYFAAKAMQGYVSGVLSDIQMVTKTLQAADRKGLTSEQYFALMSYDLADAMLEARKQWRN